MKVTLNHIELSNSGLGELLFSRVKLLPTSNIVPFKKVLKWFRESNVATIKKYFSYTTEEIREIKAGINGFPKELLKTIATEENNQLFNEYFQARFSDLVKIEMFAEPIKDGEHYQIGTYEVGSLKGKLCHTYQNAEYNHISVIYNNVELGIAIYSSLTGSIELEVHKIGDYDALQPPVFEQELVKHLLSMDMDQFYYPLNSEDDEDDEHIVPDSLNVVEIYTNYNTEQPELSAVGYFRFDSLAGDIVVASVDFPIVTFNLVEDYRRYKPLGSVTYNVDTTETVVNFKKYFDPEEKLEIEALLTGKLGDVDYDVFGFSEYEVSDYIEDVDFEDENDIPGLGDELYIDIDTKLSAEEIEDGIIAKFEIGDTSGVFEFHGSKNSYKIYNLVNNDGRIVGWFQFHPKRKQIENIHLPIMISAWETRIKSAIEKALS